MLIYWLMFVLAAGSSLALGVRRFEKDRYLTLGVAFMAVFYAILIGLRYEVGTDWFNYINTMDQIRFSGLPGAFAYKDIGYGLLNWLSLKLGLDLYGINIVCGALLMWGLGSFVGRQADPWLALTAAVPYLIIVVGMGYTRQAAAIGFLFLALNAFRDRKMGLASGLILCGALLHGSVLIVVPIALFVVLRSRMELFLPLAAFGAVLFVVLLQDRAAVLYELYFEDENTLDSAGAVIRVVMNAVPAALFLIYARKMERDPQMRTVWIIFSVISLLFVPAVLILASNTAIDRIALFFVPLQIFVFGNLPVVAADTDSGSRLVSYAMVGYFAAVLFTWLNYADNSGNWIPYQFAPFSALGY